MPGVLNVKNWYTQSFEELMEFPDRCQITNHKIVTPLSLQKLKLLDKPKHDSLVKELSDYNDKFIKVIDKIKRRHAPTTEAIARGVLEMKEHWKQTNNPLYPSSTTALPTAIQSFLDNFYTSRMCIRMLIGQHIAVSQNGSKKDFVGIICTQTK